MNYDVDIAPLRDLHELLGDGRRGYEEASERIKSPRLAASLLEFAEERRQMQNELAEVVHRLGPGKVNLASGTLKGMLHRSWIKLRDRFTRTDDLAVVCECERGERFLWDRYARIVDIVRSTPDVQRLLRHQMGRVDDTLSSIEQICSELAPDS